MATILNADTISGGFIATGDSSGILQLQSSGTPSLTLNTSGAHGVGSSPSYGTSGQVLQSNGSSAAPSWVTPSSGAMTKISTQTVSGASAIQFTGLSGYNNYLLLFQNIVPGQNYSVLKMQIGTGSTPTYISSNYSYSYMYQYGGVNNGNPSGVSFFQIANLSGNNTSSGTMAGQIYLQNVLSSSNMTANWTSMANLGNSSGTENAVAGGVVYAGAAMTAIQLYCTSTTLSGTASLYGISS